MKKTLFNDNWEVSPGVKDAFAALMAQDRGTPVTLPHDAMVYEERRADCPNGNQTGYYPSNSYTYTKNFFVPKEWEERKQYIEFEGVMSKAMVYINEEFAGSNTNGYTQFFIDPTSYLKYDAENTIKVLAINTEKSSRWYTGAGIYRDVCLWDGGKVAVKPEGCRITTEYIEEDYAALVIDTELVNKDTKTHVIKVETSIQDADGNEAAKGFHIVTLLPGMETADHIKLTVSDPFLWNTDHPYLYTCHIRLTEQDMMWDECEENFGIRTLKLDARNGLRINGKPVKLRGACIHHDNGIIGATTLPGAEEYRCRKLKEAGFNAIRSSHHPMGKTMLNTCDQLGILVMDELTDMWNVPKNAHDDALDFEYTWKDNIKSMISKDYNHPSVIMYSVGNEMPEIGRASGRIWCRQIANEIRRQDSTRYVTSGINGFLSLAGASKEDGEKMAAAFMPQGNEKEQPALDMPASNTIDNSEGSEKLNDVMGDIPFEIRDMLHGSEIMTKQIDEAGAPLDVVGLNYMPIRHLIEHEIHPDHVVVGSECYPTEIARLWQIVEENSHVIGDFTWTGFDYLGEAGIGIYHYDCMPQGQGIYPDRLAYCGDITINGYRRPVSYLREIVYGLRTEPYISVERVNRYGYGCLRNHWKYDDAIDSWTYPGYEGRPARLKVLSKGDEVELFLNGSSLGRKTAGKANGFEACYDLSYEPGELTAVQYENGIETGKQTLHTADIAERFQIHVNKQTVKADGRDTIFIELSLIDKNGIPNLWDKKEVTLTIDGPLELLGFGSANPSDEEVYRTNRATTYDGHLLAVLRSKKEAGEAKIHFKADEMDDEVLFIKIE